jgi:hypothetical protein
MTMKKWKKFRGLNTKSYGSKSSNKVPRFNKPKIWDAVAPDMTIRWASIRQVENAEKT